MGANELPGLVLGTHGTPKRYVHALANQLEAIFFCLNYPGVCTPSVVRQLLVCLRIVSTDIQADCLSGSVGWVVRNPIIKKLLVNHFHSKDTNYLPIQIQ